MSLGHFGGSEPGSRGDVPVGSGIGGIAGISLDDALRQARDQLREAPEGAYTVGRDKISAFQRDVSTASGTQAITGVGFKPYAVIFATIGDGQLQMSVGFDDGTTAACVFAQDSSLWSSNSGSSIDFNVSAGNTYVGNITSMDIDGYTITWTKTGSPTGLLYGKSLAFARG